MGPLVIRRGIVRFAVAFIFCVALWSCASIDFLLQRHVGPTSVSVHRCCVLYLVSTVSGDTSPSSGKEDRLANLFIEGL